MAFANTAQLSAPVEGYIKVDGIRVHYWERGTGRPVVLLHGNGSMIGDFVSSGVTDRMATSHRVIVFDRPGFGHSERPRGRKWGPLEQAKLFLRTFALLGIQRPIVVGHSWGTLVALALALEAPEKMAGLVLLSGYYYPLPHAQTRRPFRSPLMDEMFIRALMPFVGHAMAVQALMSIFGKRASHPTSASPHACFTKAQGMSSSMRDAGVEQLTSLVSVAVIQASGSTELSLHVSMSDAIIAQLCAPSSWPAKSAFLRLSAMPRIERSTVLESISMRPSSR